jgi:hypothetical protein
MIAGVKACHAVFSALLLLVPGAWAADDLAGAARDLARKTAAFTGRGESAAISYRNLSSLGSAELGELRAAFEATLKQSGCRASENTGATEARLTLSQSPTQYLLIEEARKGDDRQVWIASWPRSGSGASKLSGISLDRKQVWRQNEQILDIAFTPAGMLVLSPSKVSLYGRNGDSWELRQAAPLASPKPWPRDLRGRIRATGAAFQAFLPGLSCSGTADGSLTMSCRLGDEPWVLESGSRGILLANFAANRNYFDGRVVLQTGARKNAGPFYSAASVEEQGRTLWLLAMVDGRTQISDASLESTGSILNWGSDIAGIDAHCGPPSQILATRPGDGSEPDAVQAFAIVDRAPAPLTPPTIFPGPVTALWTSGGSAALAVARDLAAGDYVAYVITVACGS